MNRIPYQRGRFEIVAVHGPVFGWSLIEVHRRGNSFSDNTGTDGLLMISRQTINGYDFYLQGNEDFDLYLPRLPESLLNPDLRHYFLSNEKHQSLVSRLAPERVVMPPEYSDLVFNLPYPKGASFQVSTPPGQGHHKGAIAHAIDFDIPEGASLLPITIAKVVEIKDNSSLGGCDPDFADDANFIRLEINPGITILYLHTQPGSIAQASIKKGDTVAPGQIIAKVGHTGFTCNWTGTGPGSHLHLVMEKWCGSGNQRYICGSIPINFEEIDGSPKYGEAYVSKNTPTKTRAGLDAVEEIDIQSITDVINAFHQIYRCSTLKECDQSTLLRYSVTEALWQQLFPEDFLFCFGCVKWDSSKRDFLTLLPFDNPKGDRLTVRGEQIWKTRTSTGSAARYGEITHHSIVDTFLLRENGVWKIDGYKIICGYTLDKHGKLINQTEVREDYNLEDCPLQPPNGSKP